MKLKKTLKKIMVSLLLFIILFNFIVNTNVTYAITAEEFVNSVTAIMGGIVSICLWQFRMKAIIIAFLINELITTTMAGVSKDIVFVTPYKIFFNEVPITDLNFFDFAKKDPVFQFKESVAEWYYSLRIIAAAGLLLVLIYIGIRMAIATLSEDKAKYKKMFFDWLMSIALLFLMQYIILFIIEINNVLVEVLKTVNNDLDMDDVMLDLALRGLVGVGMNSMTSTIVYCGLVFLTFAFLISYINRMLKVGFLILISPLITITYALDKIKDNKSQALDTWFKEIAYTILIQPFHCIIYLSYISVCFKLIADRSDGGFGYTSLISSDFNELVNGVLAIFCIIFIKEAEKIVRKIFGFKDDAEKTSFAAGLATTAIVIRQASKAGQTARAASTKFKDLHLLNKFQGDMNALANSSSKLGKSLGKAGSKVADKMKNAYDKSAEKVGNKLKDLNEKINSNKVIKGYKNFKNKVSLKSSKDPNKPSLGDKLRKKAADQSKSRMSRAMARAQYNTLSAIKKMNSWQAVGAGMGTIGAAMAGENAFKSVAAGAAVGKSVGDYNRSAAKTQKEIAKTTQTQSDIKKAMDSELDRIVENSDEYRKFEEDENIEETENEVNELEGERNELQHKVDKEEDPSKKAALQKKLDAKNADLAEAQAKLADKQKRAAELKQKLKADEKYRNQAMYSNEVLQKFNAMAKKAKNGDYKKNSDRERKLKKNIESAVDKYDGAMSQLEDLYGRMDSEEKADHPGLDFSNEETMEKLMQMRAQIEAAAEMIERQADINAGVNGIFNDEEVSRLIKENVKVDDSLDSRLQTVVNGIVADLIKDAMAYRQHIDERNFMQGYQRYESLGGDKGEYLKELMTDVRA